MCIASLSAMTAAFVIEYSPATTGTSPPIDAVLTMCPPSPCAWIFGRNARIPPSDVDPRSSGFRDRYMDDIVERYLRENPELKGDRDFTDAFRDELRRQLDGKDIDHAVELQVGGLDDLENALPLDSSVNRSTGAQIAAILRRIEEDSYFRFDIDWLNPRDYADGKTSLRDTGERVNVKVGSARVEDE